LAAAGLGGAPGGAYARSRIAPETLDREAVMRADVVVVGAGALGLSTALHLALLGRDVVVVERGDAGSQASGRAAGLFKSIQADEVRSRLARRSIERASTFAEWAGVPLEVRASGSLAVARTPEHGAFLQAEIEASRGWGARILDLEAADVPARTSLYRPGGSERTWWCPEDVYIEEPMSMIDAYVAACRQHGAQLREREEVIGVELRDGAIAAVQTTAERIEAPVLVDAAGAWTRRVAALAGAWLPIAPVRHQLLITEPAADVDPSGPIVRVVDAAVYVRPSRGGLMLGGFEADPLPVDPYTQDAGFTTDDLPLDLGVLERMAGAVRAQIAAAGDLAVAEHRGGMFTMIPDGRFLGGALTHVPGLWVASGCNGSGFSSALALGEALAASITGTPSPIDLTPLAPARLSRLDDEDLVKAGVWQYAHYYDPAT
jgi:glycine/D-amino acid oxidase-like deaminating enzyme